MRAMTWWDHATQNVWAQPWGLALMGSLVDTQLRALPVALAPWGSWRLEHQDTLALEVSGRFAGSGGARLTENFVVGIALAEHAKAYPFPSLAERVVVNDTIGEFPIVLHTDPETKTVKSYLRDIGGRLLTFDLAGQRMRDRETGTLWDPVRGRAVEGPLSGEVLQQVPSNSSFQWAWFDFYPNSELFEG